MNPNPSTVRMISNTPSVVDIDKSRLPEIKNSEPNQLQEVDLAGEDAAVDKGMEEAPRNKQSLITVLSLYGFKESQLMQVIKAVHMVDNKWLDKVSSEKIILHELEKKEGKKVDDAIDDDDEFAINPCGSKHSALVARRPKRKWHNDVAYKSEPCSPDEGGKSKRSTFVLMDDPFIPDKKDYNEGFSDVPFIPDKKDYDEGFLDDPFIPDKEDYDEGFLDEPFIISDKEDYDEGYDPIILDKEDYDEGYDPIILDKEDYDEGYDPIILDKEDYDEGYYPIISDKEDYDEGFLDDPFIPDKKDYNEGF